MKSSKKRRIAHARKEGEVRGKARARIATAPVVINNNVIPPPPPRPLLLPEWIDAPGTYRTKSLARNARCDYNCTAATDSDDDSVDLGDHRLAVLDELEHQRWTRRVTETPLPNCWDLTHLEVVTLAENNTRLIDFCRPPTAGCGCSCGAIVTCIRKHPERGPVRWHRVKYVPETCCSCTGMVITPVDEYDDEEGLDGVCSSCKDCYQIVRK